ncbi:uncharacterized protein [Spinacia oleracea]|uniref:Uncharacterized protein isoform X3 n=1 Tax=Spinacia oleracea TaxID=3562 RepID=A0ABM3QNM0_SPIOL|nr:uncharacterized protein LOC130461075 isoform X3 [Spinacia oleracea]
MHRSQQYLLEQKRKRTNEHVTKKEKHRNWLCYIQISCKEIHSIQEKVSMRSIFTGCEDVPPSISRVADSVGIDMPTFELLKYDPYDWIKRSQVLSAFANAFHALQPLKSTCFQSSIL